MLVLIAAVALLFTGRCPRAIFRLVVGNNRWVLRVIACAALMRDEYRPSGSSTDRATRAGAAQGGASPCATGQAATAGANVSASSSAHDRIAAQSRASVASMRVKGKRSLAGSITPPKIATATGSSHGSLASARSSC